MSGFGERLRRQREMRGVSLEEISRSTKIGTRSLKAIEDEDFEKLPGGIFNKGFVRAYARFLGLDEEQLLGDFDEAWNAYEALRTPQVLEVPERNEKTSTAGWGWIAAAVVLALALGGWYRYQRMRAEQVAPPQRSEADTPSASSTSESNRNPQEGQAQQTAPPLPQPVQNGNAAQPQATEKPLQPPKRSTSSASTEVSPSKSPASTTSTVKSEAPIRLQVFARQDSWLSVSADGKDLGQGILSAQKTRSIRAQKEVRLTVGNMGGVQISFNGQPLDINGQPKEVKQLIFTAEGLQQ